MDKNEQVEHRKQKGKSPALLRSFAGPLPPGKESGIKSRITVHTHPVSRHPEALLIIRRENQPDIRIQLGSATSKYDTFKLKVTPSDVVNTPYVQYIGGLEFAVTKDNRAKEITAGCNDALMRGATSLRKSEMHCIRKQIPALLAKLDRALARKRTENKE